MRPAQALLTLAVGVALGGTAEAQAPNYIYVGQEDGNVAGLSFNPATGLVHVSGSPWPLPGNAQSVALHPSGRFLFAVSAGNVAVFALNAGSGAMIVPPTLFPSGGGPALFLTVHPSGRFVYLSHALTSTISVLGVNPVTGALSVVAGSPFATGAIGAAACVVDPSGRFLYVAHSQTSQVAALAIDIATGGLTPVPGSPFLAGGSNTGLTVDPTGRYLYSPGAAANAVYAYAIDGSTGALAPISGSPFGTGAPPVEATVDPTGRFLYTANNTGTISGFSIVASTGALVAMGPPSVAGTGLRKVVTDLRGRFLFATNANPANLQAWAIHPNTGALTGMGIIFTGGGNAWGVTAGRDFTRGDFDANGATDILWRHDVSGGNVIWHMNGAALSTGTFIDPPAPVDVGWKVVGTPDMNLDRETDILWRHEPSGENVVWYMQGKTLTSGTFLTPAALTDTAWKMVGTGDFNGDGRFDIVWHQRASGQVALWYMNGSVLQSGTFTSPPSIPDTNWKVVGVADFNGDQRPDLLWRHDASGQIVAWLMADSVLMTGTFTSPGALSDTGWRIVALGDYNSDRRTDILWRHATSGENAIWYMDGVSLINGTFTSPPALADTRWKIVGPR